MKKVPVEHYKCCLVSDLASGSNLDDGIRNMIDILRSWDHHNETLHAVEQALELYGKIKNRKGVLFAVNHSGDSDSTGSITWNILGLINGVGAIPGKWIKNLRFNDIVSQVAEDLHIRKKGDYFNPDVN